MYVVMIQIISIQCLIIIALFYSSDEQIARQINPLARIAGGFTHPIQLCLKASGSYSGLQHHWHGLCVCWQLDAHFLLRHQLYKKML